jgi:hypothetical protein
MTNRKRRILVLAVATLACGAVTAGPLERQLDERWLGAWVVITTESGSDCGALYTNNRVNGRLVTSDGWNAFGAGELAKIDKIVVSRSRVDLKLGLVEPLLVARQDGPFTLYDQVGCRVEIELEVPRDAVKRGDVAGIERLLSRVLERHETEDAALASRSWNGREREPYPDDYDRTLARHAAWRAEQTNAAVQVAIDRAMVELSHLSDRIDEGPAWTTGFAEGMRAARAERLGACGTLLALDLAEARRRAMVDRRGHEGVPQDHLDGFADGIVLVHGLALVRELPACFVPVPDVD